MLSLFVAACNMIVGVEDVRLRGSSSRPDSTDGVTPVKDTGTDPDPEPTSDAGTDASTKGCNGEVACVRTVFLTSQAFSGKLSGLAGADAICYQAAQTNPKLAGKTFRAWLSDATKNAADRHPHGTQAYVRLDGVVVAQHYGDLTDGTISHTINVDEQGNTLTTTGLGLSVWSASDSSGLYDGSSCNNWTTDSVTVSGAFGDSQAVDADWTEEVGEPIALATCNSQKHLYCIEY